MIRSKNAWKRYHTLKNQIINSITDKLTKYGGYIDFEENSVLLTTQKDYLVTAIYMTNNIINIRIDNNSSKPITFLIDDDEIAVADLINILESIEESI